MLFSDRRRLTDTVSSPPWSPICSSTVELQISAQRYDFPRNRQNFSRFFSLFAPLSTFAIHRNAIFAMQNHRRFGRQSGNFWLKTRPLYQFVQYAIYSTYIIEWQVYQSECFARWSLDAVDGISPRPYSHSNVVRCFIHKLMQRTQF